jgi:HAD superfamily hydrolase (TIGR01490 family)
MAANPSILRPLPQHGVLAVFDLDGTITYGDTLIPFLRYVHGTPRFLLLLPLVLPFLIGYALRLVSRTRAKEALLAVYLRGMSQEELQAHGAKFARERLPALLRPQAMERLAWHRVRGHRCAVLSASIQAYVTPWANGAGFDEVFATRLATDAQGRITGRIDGENCQGEEKVRRLEEFYGNLATLKIHGYGDTPGDRHFLARCAESNYRPFSSSSRIADLVRLARPHQWLKNGFVLVGIIFGHAWTVPSLVMSALLAVLGFSLAASAIYIVNDYADRERDRLHPKKRDRPLASGRLPVRLALGFAVLLGAGAALAAAAAGWVVLAIIAGYVVMNFAYTFYLKDVVILDVFVISAGFILRILAGTLGLGIAPSQWLIVCTLFLTLFLGFTKRRSEMLSVSGEFITHRKALLHYSAALLDKAISVCATGAIMSYSLYTMSAETAKLHGTTNLIYTIPFVLYGMFRYLYLLHAKHAGADTSRELVRDPHLLASVVGWCVVTFLLIS